MYIYIYIYIYIYFTKETPTHKEFPVYMLETKTHILTSANVFHFFRCLTNAN